MCRACSNGGRRCRKSAATYKAERGASTRYYRRGKARLLIARLVDAGVRAMDDTTMPVTYHASRGASGPPDLSRGSSLSNTDSLFLDKPRGALWAAPGRITVEGGVKTSWTDFLAREADSLDELPSGDVHGLRAEPGAVIVYVDNGDDADALMARYGVTREHEGRAFDWVSMRDDGIDCVYVTQGMVDASKREARSGAGRAFGPWDMDTAVWLSTERVALDGDPLPGGTYEVAEDGSDGGGWGLTLLDEHLGEYETPVAPSPEGAWERVPAKIRGQRGAVAA